MCERERVNICVWEWGRQCGVDGECVSCGVNVCMQETGCVYVCRYVRDRESVSCGVYVCGRQDLCVYKRIEIAIVSMRRGGREIGKIRRCCHRQIAHPIEKKNDRILTFDFLKCLLLLLMMMLLISVTRLGNFWKFFGTKFLTKVAQIFCYFGIFWKILLLK